jgi:hypothetical protein
LDVLRDASAPISTAGVIVGVLKAKGLPDDPALVADQTEKALTNLREQQKDGFSSNQGQL